MVKSRFFQDVFERLEGVGKGGDRAPEQLRREMQAAGGLRREPDSDEEVERERRQAEAKRNAKYQRAISLLQSSSSESETEEVSQESKQEVVVLEKSKPTIVHVSSDSDSSSSSSPPPPHREEKTNLKKKKKRFVLSKKKKCKYDVGLAMGMLENDLSASSSCAIRKQEPTRNVHNHKRVSPVDLKRAKKVSKKQRRAQEQNDDQDDDDEEEEDEESAKSTSNDESGNEFSGSEEGDVVGELFSRCETISEELVDAIERIDMDLGPGSSGLKSPAGKSPGSKPKTSKPGFRLISQAQGKELFPDGLELKPYQLVGLNWLRVLNEQKLNGILADEMGLGKTVQAIAILAWLKSAKSVHGPHLIVAPASTLENWRRELARWLPGHNVVVYHGSQKTRNELTFNLRSASNRGERAFDILVTTYTYFERDSCSADRGFFARFKFCYIITDEAHGIKNMNSSRYRRMVRLKSERRLLLTGTPVQNNLEEILALMSFCMPKLFDANSDKLGEYFRDKGNREITRIRDAMKPFVLRRLKADVLRQLSPKTEDVRVLDAGASQAQVYSSIIREYKASKNKSRAGGSAEAASVHYFSELRKAANHPLLVRHYFGRSADESPDNVDRSLSRVVELLAQVRAFGSEATRKMIRKEIQSYSDWALHMLAVEFGFRSAELDGMRLPEQTLWNSCKAAELRHLLPNLIADGHRVLVFSQWTTLLDLIEEMNKALRIEYVRFDGQTEVKERQSIVDTFNTDMSIKVCLLSTRAGGMGINLTSADTVILHDLDFNPSLDRQAEDRCHRIGQTKPVRVIKLVTKDTVDEKILNMQHEKKRLDESLMKNIPTPAKEKKKKKVDPVKLIMAQI